ncbi:MAG: GNAT family N-acetyltransferase [Tannerellaceae bacterium]|jgi:ribosomal protein S18 acetylase RimI-like enzyme|nr:GNAT family N-acetyltransferase [Tannerellaceae bacterium]
MIRLLIPKEYDTWIEIAREVEPPFGPMINSKEFQDSIKNCIKRNSAYGIDNENGKIVGIVALDRGNNEILWLAVKKKYRGNHYGDKLVKQAIDELENNGDIFVQTFANGVLEGENVRILYTKHGFIDFKNAGKNPAGIETVIMIKRKR